jgi:hypothetical protein
MKLNKLACKTKVACKKQSCKQNNIGEWLIQVQTCRQTTTETGRRHGAGAGGGCHANNMQTAAQQQHASNYCKTQTKHIYYMQSQLFTYFGIWYYTVSSLIKIVM